MNEGAICRCMGVFLLLLVLCFSSLARSSELKIEAGDSSPHACVNYHLTNVRAIWSEQLRRARAKFDIHGQGVRDARQQIEVLRKDMSWFGIQATDQSALASGMFAQATLTAAKLADNLLLLDPKYKAARTTSVLKTIVLDNLRKGRGQIGASGKKDMLEKATDVVMDGLKKAYDPVGQGARTIRDLAADMNR
jgi:hypothetical protein